MRTFLYEKPLSEKEANAYELVWERRLDFSHRYMAASGTSILKTFATAAELNKWWEARDTEGRYFCRLYDREKSIDILGFCYMFLELEERFNDAEVSEESVSNPFEMRQS